MLLPFLVAADRDNCGPTKRGCKPGLSCLPRTGSRGYCGMPEEAFSLWNSTTTQILLPASDLKGTMPDLSPLTNVEVLDLSFNRLLEKGPLWPWLENLRKLRVLRLTQSGRTGAMNAIDWSVFSTTLSKYTSTLVLQGTPDLHSKLENTRVVTSAHTDGSVFHDVLHMT